MRKKLLVVDFVDFNNLSSEQPKVTIGDVPRCLGVIILPLF